MLGLPFFIVGEELRSAVLGPLILTANLLLFLRSEVVLDVERLPDLLGAFALNHVGDGFAPYVKQCLDIHVVGCEDYLEQHLLIDLHELLVPIVNVGRLFARLGVLVGSRGRVILVVITPVQDLSQHRLRDLQGTVSKHEGRVGVNGGVDGDVRS